MTVFKERYDKKIPTGAWSTHDYYHADGSGNITMLISNSSTALAVSDPLLGFPGCKSVFISALKMLQRMDDLCSAARNSTKFCGKPCLNGRPGFGDPSKFIILPEVTIE